MTTDATRTRELNTRPAAREGVSKQRPTRSSESISNTVIGSIWMVVIALVLFFLPLVNGVIGGLVGGYRAGSVKRGLVASLLPAAVVALGLWVLLAVFDLPLVGLFTGVAVGVLILFADLGLFIGAAAGGYLASARG